MRAPAAWEIVGGDPAPGDPCAFQELAQYFGDTATNAMEAECRLRRLVEGADETVWRGEAADAFREDVGKLPERLGKLYHSYNSAAEALRVYGVSLAQLQARAGAELDKAIAADQEQAAFIENLVSNFTPGTFPSETPVGMGPGPAPAGPPAPDPTESARNRLAAARAEIERIRQEREDAEGKALGALDHAGDIGIHNKSRWSRITGWVGDRVDDLRDLDHMLLRAIGDLADRVAPIITGIGMALVAAAIVAAIVVGGPAGMAAAGILWSTSGTVFTAAAVTSAVGVGAKIASKATYHDPDLSWGSLGIEAGLAAVSLAGGTMQSLREGSSALRGTKLFQSGARNFNLLTSSGTRRGIFALRASQIGSQAWARAGAISTRAGTAWRTLVGTQEAPTLAGMIFKLSDEARGLWANHVNSPLRFIPGIGLGSETVTNVALPGATQSPSPTVSK